MSSKLPAALENQKVVVRKHVPQQLPYIKPPNVLQTFFATLSNSPEPTSMPNQSYHLIKISPPPQEMVQ